MLRRRFVASTLAASSAASFSSYPCALGRTAALGWKPSQAECTSTCMTSVRQFSTTKALWARGAGKPSTPGSSILPNFTPWAGGSSSGGTESTADSLTPQVRNHLARVYSLLGAGVATAGISSAAMFMTPLGKIIPWWFPMFGGLVPLFWLMMRPPATVNGRLGLFFAFTTLEGMAIAPIVKMSAIKGVLGTSLVLTGAVFAGFSAAAYLSPRASMLALQGPLFGMLIGMVAVSLLNMIYPTAFAHSLILYGGLALFSMFVAVDTQAMIERARCGAGDHVQDALQMFLNVVNIFIRIAQILGGMGQN